MILKYCNRWHPLLIQENKLNSPAGNRTLVPCVTGGDTHHYTTEDFMISTGCAFIKSWWFWSNVIDGVLYKYRKINWTPRQGIEPSSPAFPAWHAGIPRDTRGYSTLYYQGLSIWNRLWVYKFFMILKYWNRWHPLLIQENKLKFPRRESNPGLPRDRRGYSPLYYRGLSMLNRLWVYKILYDSEVL